MIKYHLKAPISNIESLLQALLRTLPPESLNSERTKRITTLMGESVERFKRTIANLTEVVKLQKENSGEAVLVELSGVIKEVMLDLDPLIKEAKAQVEINLASCPSVHFSEKNLRSVVYNLLSNALKYRSAERIAYNNITCEDTSSYQVLTKRQWIGNGKWAYKPAFYHVQAVSRPCGRLRYWPVYGQENGGKCRRKN